MARYSIFKFAGRLLLVNGHGFCVRQHSMMVVACGGMQWYAAVWLSPLVVVRWAVEGDEQTEMAFIRWSIPYSTLIFFSKNTWDRKSPPLFVRQSSQKLPEKTPAWHTILSPSLSLAFA
jgi:hypothetical protein